MDQQEALNLARKLLMSQNLNAGTPAKVVYHPEGGKSLENVERIRDYTSILSVPYWEIFFNANSLTFANTVGHGEMKTHQIEEDGYMVAIVFNNQRAFLQTRSSGFERG